MTAEILALYSGYVLSAGAICVAVTNIIKFLSPLTAVGKKKAQERKKAREEENKSIIEQSINEYNTKAEQRFSELASAIDTLKQSFEEIAQLNKEQTQSLQELDKKIDLNEIDRLRWEILNFSNDLRRGRAPSQDEFRHIFKIYKKYEDTLTNRGMTNGEVDTEYLYIKEEYLKNSKEEKIDIC